MTITINGSGTITGATTMASATSFSSTVSAAGNVTLAGAAVKVLNNSGNPVVQQTGSVIQVVNTTSSSYVSTTTTIPYDDTIPQNTEGVELMTLAITPTSTTSKLLITVTVVCTATVALYNTVALFQDSTASALAAAVQTSTADYLNTITFSYYMTAGTTSATTFKVRGGGSGAGTFSMNGSGGARKYGGVSASSITIQELAA